MKLYILSQYGSWLTCRLNRKYKSLADFCLLSDFHLALQSSMYSLLRCTSWFLFIIPLFFWAKSALRERKLAEVNQTCEGPWGESHVSHASVFLLLDVRESPLGQRWRGELVRDYLSFLSSTFSPEMCSLPTIIVSCFNQDAYRMGWHWPLFVLEMGFSQNPAT